MKQVSRVNSKASLLLKFFFLLAWVLGTNVQSLYAQSSMQSVLNASSSSKVIKGQLHEFSIGEMVLIETFKVSSHSMFLSQGFLQPNYRRSSLSENDVWVVNNVVTPNKDGANDYFVIEGLGKYPANKLYIYDKAGRRIYTSVNYQNNWDGTLDGKTLNEDAYYYIIDLGPGFSPIKGSVSIVLK